jgi:hypothetical protein
VTDNFNPHETYEQERVAAWLKYIGVPDDAYTAIPLGEKRDKITAAKLERMGVKRGGFDIIFWTMPPIGLEMKRRKGGCLSVDQQKVHARCRQAGWSVLECHGAEAAKSDLLKLAQFRELF